MAAIVDLQVKTISTEIINPLTPTPCHLKSYTLSLLDQIRPPYHSIMLLFYPKTIDTALGGPDMNVLKSSLSETLSKYYLFAGRCIDDFTVSCNDQGIPFTETRVDFVLSDFLTSPNKVDHLHKLTPPKKYTEETWLPKRVPLAFQVNIFSCGGVVIGCYKLHKLLLDGTSLVAFLKYWAAIAANSWCDKDNIIVPVAPDFDAGVASFPPRPTLGWRPFDANCPERQALVQSYQGTRIVAKSFVFNKHAINELRVMATSDEVPRPTRVEALAGFVWEHCMAAASCVRTSLPAADDRHSSIMTLAVNMRARINPPLPTTALGNLVTTASARAKDEIMSLPELVREIHLALSNMSDIINSYKGGQNIEALVADVAPLFRYQPGSTYGLSSWCQFGLDEVNFGFGKPTWASPTDGILSPLVRNCIYFVLDCNGDGIEVWLYLEEKEMQTLESNKKFLAYAWPN